MKFFYLAATVISTLVYSCSKEDLSINTDVVTHEKTTLTQVSTPTATKIYNPIVGRWELGVFKLLCPGAKDTMISQGMGGDFVDFLKTDTAFYTYNTLNATGWTPYKILDSSRFVLGDTMHITSFDGIQLTTYTKSMNGGSEQWMTYKKVSD
jgi:hypothetical protein